MSPDRKSSVRSGQAALGANFKTNLSLSFSLSLSFWMKRKSRRNATTTMLISDDQRRPYGKHFSFPFSFLLSFLMPPYSFCLTLSSVHTLLCWKTYIHTCTIRFSIPSSYNEVWLPRQKQNKQKQRNKAQNKQRTKPKGGCTCSSITGINRKSVFPRSCF